MGKAKLGVALVLVAWVALECFEFAVTVMYDLAAR